MNKQKIYGYIMAGIGFAMLLVNAFGYVFNRGIKSPAFTILGLVFVATSLNMARRKNK